MASNIEDFVRRLTRTGRQFTFVFTEDFFDIMSKNGVNTQRFLDIRNTVKNVGAKKGTNAQIRQDKDVPFFDVNIMVVKKGFSSFMSDFEELISEPFSDKAVIYGAGGDMVDAAKAKLQVGLWFGEKNDRLSSTTSLLNDLRKRKLVLVVESAADLKRPSMEPLLRLRSQLSKVLVNPAAGPVVDCQVSRIYQEGNSSSLSNLLNMFCVHYS